MGPCPCNIIFSKLFKKRKNYITILESCLPLCRLLMAVFIDVNHDSALPAKEEIARSRPEKDGNTQPHVVGHEDEHQTVADKHLDDME